MTYPPPPPGDPYQQLQQPYQQYPTAPPYQQSGYQHPAYQYYSQPGGPTFLPPEAGPQSARFHPAQPVRVLANPGRRLVARLLDTLILGVVVGGLAVALAGITNGFGTRTPSDAGVVVGIVLAVVIALAALLYDPVFIATKGGTPGKLIMGIRVVKVSTAHYPGFGAALGRYLMTFVFGIVPLGSLLNVLWCCWDRPLYQCLHDKVVSTVVVHKEGEDTEPGLQYGRL
ncbi:RDD family protein [Kibdelosporangium persicum]|uniref:RDD family membrane protein YckC n=1 Tax=Kibdelosporangium persicum TaxID=2698649 RepID=A0ABX2EVV8_9PSEU|nr:RDD family protein [Kibdelosporangium persicum]NRN62882.1 putative RDD family membrane protein YckC [Kibdelosporangium persicum]